HPVRIGSTDKSEKLLGSNADQPWGHVAETNTRCAWARSRAAGVTIVRSAITILRPCRIACFTSSSHTNATAAPVSLLAAEGAGSAPPPSNESIWRRMAGASMPAETGGAGAWGNPVAADEDAALAAGI